VVASNKFLDERLLAVAVLPLGLALALLVPGIGAALAPFTLSALFLLMLFSLAPFARVPLNELVNLDRGTVRTLLWLQVVLPALMVSLGIIAKLPDNIIVLTIVTACAGSLFASPTLAELLQLDRRKTLQCMVLSTLTMPVSLFAFLSLLKGDEVQMDVLRYLERTMLFLVLPSLLFLAYRPIAARLCERRTAHIEFGARWAVVAALTVFGMGLMHAVVAELEITPTRVFFYLLVVTLLCCMMLALSSIVMHRFGRVDALTTGILAGFRNVGLGFALVGDMIGHDLAVYVGVSMLPIFTAPLVLRLVSLRPRSTAPA
jgi:hypothetical protein